MANEFYNRGANFNPDELADGDAIESEFDAVARGFDKINTAIDTDRAGYPTQAFHVAPATEATHAVRKEQLDAHVNDQGGAHGATSDAVPNKIMIRDSNGDVSVRNLVGNSSSATKLYSARKINGVPFDGSQDIVATQGGFTFRNKIVDGRFDFWYEGTTQSSNGYGSDTMWQNLAIGSTHTHSQQALTIGVDLPAIDCPTAKYFSRTVVTSVAGANNLATKFQNIEGVGLLAGKTVTVSFYAKADAVKNIALTMSQVFGTGGSPSSLVNGIGAQLVSLSTVWKRYTAQITLPSISGKTLGTTGDYLQLCFWFDGGSSTTGSILGQQSGTFDIACVQLEEGSVMTPFEELPIEISQQRVNRYFQHRDGAVGSSRFPVQSFLSNNIYKFQVPLITPMRTVPAVTHNMSDATFSTSITTSNKTWGMLTDGVAWSTKSSGTFVIGASANDRLVDVMVSGGVLGSMTTPVAASIGGLTYFNLDARL